MILVDFLFRIGEGGKPRASGDDPARDRVLVVALG